MGILDPSIAVAFLSMLGTLAVGFWSYLQETRINTICAKCPYSPQNKKD